jgi:murein DD-endopeptidase MepM/ murein hydrolase activator NlpD
MRWSARFGRRVGAVALLVAVAVVVTGADSAAVVPPDWTEGAVAPRAAPVVTTAPDLAGAVAATAPRGRWTWPLLPRPPVVAPFDPPDVRWASGHRGVDLGASAGEEVRAPAAGVVTFRGVVVDRGVLVLATADGLRTTFEPVDSPLAVGDTVSQGQVVATVAATPGHCAPATCLHWGVLRGDTYLDPLLFVGAVRVVLLPLRPP